MKKKLIILLVLCLIFSGQSIARAQEGIDVTLVEPNVEKLVKGQDVNYKINVNFTKPTNQFSNLFITFRLSEGLDFKSVNLVGVNQKPGALETIATPNSEGRYGFVTLRLTDIKALENVTNFSLDIIAEVNSVKKDGEKLNNTYTVSFQTDDLKTHYYQKTQESKVTVSSKSAKPVEPKEPTQPKEPTKPTEPAKPVTTVKKEDITLATKTGSIYAKFMDKIEGFTIKGAIIETKIGVNVQRIEVDDNGRFIVQIPNGLESDIIINAKDSKGNIAKSITARYVTEETITQQDIDLVVESLKSLGYEDVVMRYLREFNRYTESINIALGLDGGTKQDNFELFKQLYFATRSRDSQVLYHEAFMNGYPEGNFLPGNSITRAETAAILSRIIAGGEIDEKNSVFPDVKNGKWYTKYITHLSEQGIMKGYDDGKFMPQNKITRAEFATIISRMNKLEASELMNFKDMDYSHWAAGDIMKVVTAGIMEGYPDKTFGHTKNVTRAEAATIINRALKRVPDKEYIDKNNIVQFSDIKKHWAYYQIVEATFRHEYVIENGVEKYR